MIFSCANEQVPNCKTKISPAEKLALIGTSDCEACTQWNTEYKWIISVKTPENSSYQEVRDVANMVSTKLDSRMLAINAGALEGGNWYKARLESWVKNTKPGAVRVYGFSEYEREVNKPPDQGSCDVTPKLGYTFQTDFTISCTGWHDDTKLIYSVTAKQDSNKAELPVSPGVAHSVGENYNLPSIKLPVGLSQNDFKIDLIITIKDEDDASTQVVVKVQVNIEENWRAQYCYKGPGAGIQVY